jgi:hypothetical protein
MSALHNLKFWEVELYGNAKIILWVNRVEEPVQLNLYSSLPRKVHQFRLLLWTCWLHAEVWWALCRIPDQYTVPELFVLICVGSYSLPNPSRIEGITLPVSCVLFLLYSSSGDLNKANSHHCVLVPLGTCIIGSNKRHLPLNIYIKLDIL